MQFLSLTKNEEIAAVPAFFCDLFTYEVPGKKEVHSLLVQSLIISKANNHRLALSRDTKDTQKGQKLCFRPPKLSYGNGKCNCHKLFD